MIHSFSSFLLFLMAWTCSASSNSGLIAKLRAAGIVSSPRVLTALSLVDRSLFVPSSLMGSAFEDRPLPLGYGATISAPHMHGLCLELMEPWAKDGAVVLDVGSGSGFLAAVLATMIGKGKVVGLEHVPELVQMAKENCSKDRKIRALVENGTLILAEGDGRLGWSKEAPFDCIHVGASAADFPENLMKQLKVGGRLVVPVGPANSAQILYTIDRVSESEFKKNEVTGVVYVPLTSYKK